MDNVLVVCGAGASSTFLVHAMRREIADRGLRMSVDAATVEGLERRAQNVSLVLVARHLEDAAPGIRSALSSDIRVAILPAVPPTGVGAGIAVDMAIDLLSRCASSDLDSAAPALLAPDSLYHRPLGPRLPNPRLLKPHGVTHG